MKTTITNYGEVQIIADAYKIEIEENEDKIQIRILDFCVDRDPPWSEFQSQIIEKKHSYDTEIERHVKETIID